MNEWQESRFVRNMLASMFNTIAGKRIALFGISFKANTGGHRESPALAVASESARRTRLVAITDPKALDNARADSAGLEGTWRFRRRSYAGGAGARDRGADRVGRLPHLDYRRIFESMVKPAFMFDGRNISITRRCTTSGFNVYPIGKKPLKHV